MLDRQYWRALYNEERDAYVVEEAGWIDDEPQIEYRFSCFSDEDDDEIAGLGGLDKWWLNEDGFVEGEFFAFGLYPDQAAFDADVERILEEAEKLAQDDNLDFCLAVIDIAKEWAVEAELDDDSLFEFEGLFDYGVEDAYSLRPYDPNRLHDHVEHTQDECWRLQVVKVVDPQQHMLGWSVCAVLYPDLTSEAIDEAAAAETARILDLTHFESYSDAIISVNGTLLFMIEGDRVKDPECADLDDSFVFERIIGSLPFTHIPTHLLFSFTLAILPYVANVLKSQSIRSPCQSAKVLWLVAGYHQVNHMFPDRIVAVLTR